MEQNNYFDHDKPDKYLEARIKTIKESTISDHNKEIILAYVRASQVGKAVSKGQKRIIASGRIVQSIGLLRLMAEEWFKCDLDKVTEQQMEDFVYRLDKGQLLNNRGTPYTSESKANIKKFIRKFYKYLLGSNKSYPSLVEWVDTSKKDAEIKAIPGLKEGVWRIIELIPDLRRKALVWVAFDSGFREGELINAKIKDVEIAEDGTAFLKCVYSKTKSRTVGLPYSSQLLKEWLSMHPDKHNPEAQLWATSRVMFDKTIKVYGKHAHKINIFPHMIRHTSATFWAPKLDRTSFCKRFGWAYSSSMPDRYIDFSKVAENKLVENVKKERVAELEEKNRQLELMIIKQQEETKRQFQELQEALFILQKHKK